MSTHRSDTESHSIHHRHVRAQDEAADLVLPGERATEASDGTGDRLDQTPVTDLYHPSLYINRELSWLAFNQRVLAEALDVAVPLLERIKFIAITCSNLDEFFMIRVAGLRQLHDLGVPDLPPDGMTPEDVLDRIKACPEVCRVFCATANPVQVVVARTGQGGGILGVIDGSAPAGVEGPAEKAARKGLLRRFGYKFA